jgi:hypothetical protein
MFLANDDYGSIQSDTRILLSSRIYSSLLVSSISRFSRRYNHMDLGRILSTFVPHYTILGSFIFWRSLRRRTHGKTCLSCSKQATISKSAYDPAFADHYITCRRMHSLRIGFEMMADGDQEIFSELSVNTFD